MAKIANENFDISAALFNPCPRTELVAFTGSLHDLVTGEELPKSSATADTEL